MLSNQSSGVTILKETNRWFAWTNLLIFFFFFATEGLPYTVNVKRFIVSYKSSAIYGALGLSIHFKPRISVDILQKNHSDWLFLRIIFMFCSVWVVRCNENIFIVTNVLWVGAGVTVWCDESGKQIASFSAICCGQFVKFISVVSVLDIFVFSSNFTFFFSKHLNDMYTEGIAKGI